MSSLFLLSSVSLIACGGPDGLDAESEDALLFSRNIEMPRVEAPVAPPTPVEEAYFDETALTQHFTLEEMGVEMTEVNCETTDLTTVTTCANDSPDEPKTDNLSLTITNDTTEKADVYLQAGPLDIKDRRFLGTLAPGETKTFTPEKKNDGFGPHAFRFESKTAERSTILLLSKDGKITDPMKKK